MIVAVTIWNNRISPVFDVAQNLLLIDREIDQNENKRHISIAGLSPTLVVETLKRNRIEMVICGAISETFYRLLTGSGIRVEPWICGDADEIIRALFLDRLSDRCYHMPGCCRMRGKAVRNRHGRWQRNK